MMTNRSSDYWKTGWTMSYSKYEVMRDPISGERLSAHISKQEKSANFGPTGVLRGRHGTILFWAALLSPGKT